ncbi:aldo/keto reductase [Actinomadura livida]|uniref:Aldo/keto reductase n=1 Tax=Actinomadura livida TaxID=79909 RepID=A0A7W7MWX6_9ACTN|nr:MULTISPECIES: aldo/keto reductase [Actinomadura]MBB4774186.1 aryl-alcohol dehydrogenase-like predicted oxidoreductase [Actinomadura catellatispora]GGT84284.1 NADP-dependent aryl-alcohol dehydrogenase [Actinomadura livida]
MNKIGDLDVFPLCMGGNVFGWTAGKERSFEILDAYAAAGGNFIDTSDSYMASAPGNSGGESETIIGEWTETRGNRDDVVIATKVGRHPERRGLSPANIRAAADDSLRRLRTDRIDLYFTHFDDPSVPVEEIMKTLDELVTEGKVRQIAVSNIEIDRLQASLEFAEREGTAQYTAIQPHYNLVSRDTYEGPRRDLAERYGLAAVPYYGLASGFLTGKYRPGANVDSVRAEKAARYLETERGNRVLAALDIVAEEQDTAVATVALAWLAAQPTVAAPIASARTMDQLPPLIDAARTTLTDDQLARLTEASA